MRIMTLKALILKNGFTYFFIKSFFSIDFTKKTLYHIITNLRITLIFKKENGKMTYKTEKRTRIIEFLSTNRDKSFSIEEICLEILPDGKGKSTVYRQISSLVKEGRLRRTNESNSRRIVYQYIDENSHCEGHLHLKCKECGTLIHLSRTASEILEDNILKSAGFSLDIGALLFGVCDSCAHANG